jgi:hypothetical protein
MLFQNIKSNILFAPVAADSLAADSEIFVPFAASYAIACTASSPYSSSLSGHYS